MKRILTPLGRIALIKALLISKLNYILLTLPNPSEPFLKELNKILFKLVWITWIRKLEVKHPKWKPLLFA